MNLLSNTYYIGKVNGKWQILYSGYWNDLKGPLQNDDPISESMIENLDALCYVNQQTGEITIHNSRILLHNFSKKLLEILPK